MEKSIISLEDSLDSVFGLSSKDWKLYSPLTLAYLGDAVYEMVIRTSASSVRICRPRSFTGR